MEPMNVLCAQPFTLMVMDESAKETRSRAGLERHTREPDPGPGNLLLPPIKSSSKQDEPGCDASFEYTYPNPSVSITRQREFGWIDADQGRSGRKRYPCSFYTLRGV